MAVSAGIVAVLPIPLAGLKAIPSYARQTGYLSVYASLYCFLLLGFTFFNRDYLAKIFCPHEVSKGRGALRLFFDFLPFLLISLSAVMAYEYVNVLRDSVYVAEAEMNATRIGGELPSAYLYLIRSDMSGSRVDDR